MPAFRLLATAVFALAPLVASAQPYPNKPVRIVVAFTAGGTSDIMARTLAQRLSERYKQPFVVENKPGAGGNIGTEYVVRAPADGYTLIVNSVGPMAVNSTLYKGLSYDPLVDLVPIAQISDVPNVLVVHPSIGVKDVKGLIAYAKANTGKLNRAANDFIADKNVEQRMIEEGADPAGGTPEKFGAFVKSEFEKWRTVVRESGATVN